MTTGKSTLSKKQIRYEIEVEGAKGFLAPLTFPVAEAALGFMFRQYPKKITAGEIVLNSLFQHGSPKYKNTKIDSPWWTSACLEASKILDMLAYERTPDDRIVVKDHTGKEFSCKLGEIIPRDTLEDALGLLAPNAGNAMPLTAGKLIVDACWLEGDEEIKTNHELLIPVCLSAYYRINKAESTLKKL